MNSRAHITNERASGSAPRQWRNYDRDHRFWAARQAMNADHPRCRTGSGRHKIDEGRKADGNRGRPRIQDALVDGLADGLRTQVPGAVAIVLRGSAIAITAGLAHILFGLSPVEIGLGAAGAGLATLRLPARPRNRVARHASPIPSQEWQDPQVPRSQSGP